MWYDSSPPVPGHTLVVQGALPDPASTQWSSTQVLQCSYNSSGWHQNLHLWNSSCTEAYGHQRQKSWGQCVPRRLFSVKFPGWGDWTLLCGLFWLISFRHGKWDKFTAATRNLVVYILRKRALYKSRIGHSWINTGSATLFMHRLSAVSSSGSSIKETTIT